MSLTMDHQQQTQQTEQIIVDMLEFLDSSSEEGDDLENFTKTQKLLDEQLQTTVKKDFNDNILPVKTEKILNLQNSTKKAKSCLIKELQKLKEQFPLWIDTDIANNVDAESFNYTSDNNNHLDWYSKLETKCRRYCNSNSYIQEVQKAIYGDKTGHPPNGSPEYYQAAQNYLETMLNEKNACGSVESTNVMANLNSGLYPLTQGLGAIGGGGHGNMGKLNTTSAPLSYALTAGSTASSAAYYQLCSSLNNHPRPTISSNDMNSATYGIFFGNKVTYVATAPTAPSLLYNQHSKTTTNFISNSLANAALATSPTILYTNPMLSTTTQQYLNTFFKETQFLGAAGLTANTAGQVNGTTTGLYQRLVYAQMLQQQLYHQTQQAAAVAAMFHHKQRAAAVAAAAVTASNRQQTNAAVNTNRTSPQHFNTATTTANGIVPIAGNSSNRHIANGSSPSPLSSSTSSDFAKTKPPTSSINNTPAIISTSSVANIENVSE